jgi:RHH-type proline utilization regulon transcriptional repressor/proline dehydrogenase/delta 1-pyrroline-5-carboxylate dehydrogenase
MGRTIEGALERAKAMEAKGYGYSYDMLGEAARTSKDAERYFGAYKTAIQRIGEAASGRGPVAGPGISVKLSALHPRYELAQKKRVMDELLPRLEAWRWHRPGTLSASTSTPRRPTGSISRST